MGDTWNALSLLGCRGGHQRPRGSEQDLMHSAGLQRRQEVAAQQACAASAAGTAGVGILRLWVEHHGTAVPVHPGDVVALFHHQIAQQLAADQPQIAGDNGVIGGGLRPRALQVADNGICGSRRHGSAHMAGIGHAKIDDLPNASAGDADSAGHAVRLL